MSSKYTTVEQVLINLGFIEGWLAGQQHINGNTYVIDNGENLIAFHAALQKFMKEHSNE